MGDMALSDLPSVLRTIGRTGLLRPVAPRKLADARRELKRWGQTVGGIVATSAALHPDDVFIIDADHSYTRKQVHQRSTALAKGLSDRGVAPGSKVAVLCRNHSGFVEVTAALDKLGAHVLYLNTGFAWPQISEVMGREQPVALICDPEFAEILDPEGTDWATFTTLGGADDPDSTEALIRSGGSGEPPEAKAPGTAIILTSGTTGTPKGAEREQQSDFRPGIAILERIQYRYGDTTVIAAPLFHSWGFANLGVSLLLNNTMILRPRFDPEQAMADIDRHKARVLAVVPIMVQRMLDLPPEVRTKYDLSSLEVVALGGSSIPAGVVERWRAEYGDNLYNMYGSTEVGTVSIATPDDLRDDARSAGRPPLYTDVRLLDDHGTEVPRGEVGRIFVKSALLFGGYTDGGNKELIDGYMSTGDTGRFDAKGRLIVEGRDDEMVVSGGENVFPREVEDLLSAHPDVVEAAVIGVDDDEFGKRLAAFVVRRDTDLSEDDVKGHVRNNLARHKVPRDVTFIEQLPRNATGKVLKRELAKG
jgi:fatty-acyl-CoA synthase